MPMDGNQEARDILTNANYDSKHRSEDFLSRVREPSRSSVDRMPRKSSLCSTCRVALGADGQPAEPNVGPAQRRPRRTDSTHHNSESLVESAKSGCHLCAMMLSAAKCGDEDSCLRLQARKDSWLQ